VDADFDFSLLGRRKKAPACGALVRCAWGSGVSSSLSMKMETFFLGYPPGRPLGCLACTEEPVASSDAVRFFTEVCFRPHIQVIAQIGFEVCVPH
jgi:hypothetical protein